MFSVLEQIHTVNSVIQTGFDGVVFIDAAVVLFGRAFQDVHQTGETKIIIITYITSYNYLST